MDLIILIWDLYIIRCLIYSVGGEGDMGVWGARWDIDWANGLGWSMDEEGKEKDGLGKKMNFNR